MQWTPKRVVATPAAYDQPHGRRIMALVEAAGIEEERLPGNRLTGLRGRPTVRPTPGPSRRWPSW